MPGTGFRMGVAPVVLSSGGVGVIRHGAVASTPRPAVFAQYIWLGTVLPENMVADDMYVKEPE